MDKSIVKERFSKLLSVDTDYVVDQKIVFECSCGDRILTKKIRQGAVPLFMTCPVCNDLANQTFQTPNENDKLQVVWDRPTLDEVLNCTSPGDIFFYLDWGLIQREA